jgi:hypothetical protein
MIVADDDLLDFPGPIDQQADLPVHLKRKFSHGPGGFRADNVITGDISGAQTVERLELGLLQSLGVTGYFGDGCLLLKRLF